MGEDGAVGALNEHKIYHTIPGTHPPRSILWGAAPCSYEGLHHLVPDCTARSLTYRAQAGALGAALPGMPLLPPPRRAWWSAGSRNVAPGIGTGNLHIIAHCICQAACKKRVRSWQLHSLCTRQAGSPSAAAAAAANGGACACAIVRVPLHSSRGPANLLPATR